MPQARRSGGLATDQKVGGSNPFGRAIAAGHMAFDLRERVTTGIRTQDPKPLIEMRAQGSARRLRSFVLVSGLHLMRLFADEGVIVEVARRCGEAGRGLPRMKVLTPLIRKTSTCLTLLLAPSVLLI